VRDVHLQPLPVCEGRGGPDHPPGAGVRGARRAGGRHLLERWQAKEYGFPYLHDEAQDVARAFGAVCTPDIFVYDRTKDAKDGSRKLAYRGRIDDSWKDESKVTRHELAEALDALVSGRAPSPQQRPSMGCSIKWRQQA
jgi:hypothetical protein